MPNLTLSALQEDPDDLSGSITWPATTGSSLAFNGGELILKNRGMQFTYTSSDGSQTLTFGAYYDAGSFTNATPSTGATPNQYDGPYALVVSGSIDLTDEAFRDVEIYGDIGYFADPTTGQYKVHLRSGDSPILGQDIPPNAIGPVHLHGATGETGTFIGTARATNSGGNTFLNFFSPNSGDPFEFHTNTGDGDNLNQLGGIPGAYLIAQASVSLLDTAYQSFPVLYTSGIASFPQPACTWPSTGPARSMIAFCTLFPGSSSQPVVNGGGGSFSAGTYLIRYCFYKNLTLQANLNSFPRVTQIIETPLSTTASVTVASGTTDSMTFTVPPIPAGWDGMRLYLNYGVNGGYGPLYALQTLGTNYTVSGNTVTLTSFYGALTATTPSYGFSAWPSGTLLAKDPNATKYHLMKWAHFSPTTDPATGNYSIIAYHDGQATVQPHQSQPNVTANLHLQTNAVTARTTLTDRVVFGTAGGGGGGLAPNAGASGTVATSSTTSNWSGGSPVTSTWNLTPNQYDALMASGGNVRFQFMDAASGGNPSAWSNIISGGISTSSFALQTIGTYVSWCTASANGAGGIVTDLALNFNGGSPQMVVTWQPVNADTVSSRTVYIFAKAVGLSPT